MSAPLFSELSSPSSSIQESTVYSDYGPDEELKTQSQAHVKSTTKSASKKSPFLKYPGDIQRLTRRGLCTYGINTGPVPDDTDWAKLTIAMLREQLVMREMPDDGKKGVLVERLENLKTYKPEVVAIRDAPDDKPFGPISRNTSSKGEKRFFVNMSDKGHVGSVKKAMKEDMFVIKQFNDLDSGVSFSLRGTGPDTYDVTIGTKTSYIMTHAFRAPAELLPQRTLFAEEIKKLVDRAPKVRFTAAEASQYFSLSDGVPRSKDGKSCPVCFKDIGEAETVCCGWTLTCAVCQVDWSNTVI
ncbi:SAP domain-containing protein [Colletotrichum salicis]|uniref:SAP domain-containing protein n=1 Tax=Colletotrichum salicis TaxID=1209931 RepID=A0A135U0A9_9PEZI|nr:SAP domain-containing protein [Colletotrichum salicis]